MHQLCYPQVKLSQYLLNRRLNGPQSQSGCLREQYNLLLLLGFEPRLPGHPVHSLATIILSQFLIYILHLYTFYNCHHTLSLQIQCNLKIFSNCFYWEARNCRIGLVLLTLSLCVWTDEHLLLHHQANLAKPGAARMVLPRVCREAELPSDWRTDATEDT